MIPRIVAARLSRVHSDQRGAISVLTVFAVFMFTILLVLIMNVGRQIDDKLRMQNAADAAAYSGGVVVARGMNALAFCNHLECEVFALVAYLREARDRHSDPFIPRILAAWRSAGERFATAGLSSGYLKFRDLGSGILQKIPVEQRMFETFSAMAYHQSRMTLPIFESILAGPNSNPVMTGSGISDGDPEGGYIPRFQRAVVQTIPAIALAAADGISQRYGEQTERQHKNVPLRSLVWKTDAEPISLANEYDPFLRTLPVVDPSPSGFDYPLLIPKQECYRAISLTLRARWARHYLEEWITTWQSPYFEWPHNANPTDGATTAKMSNYINLFRVFACAQLDDLLNHEYPDTNMPFLLRDPPNYPDSCWVITDPDAPPPPCPPPEPLDSQQQLRDYRLIGTSYWPHMTTMFPGLFHNPISRNGRSYAVTFAEAAVFLPRARFASPWTCTWQCVGIADKRRYFTHCCGNCVDEAPGEWDRYTLSVTSPAYVYSQFFDGPRAPSFPARRERFGQWDLFNQNWSVKLVPASSAAVLDVVPQHPSNFLPGYLSGLEPPNIQNVGLFEFWSLSQH
jgi:hypothetical protein